jgi:lambda family phage minor tail protein L
MTEETEASGGANGKNIREIARGSLVRFYEIDLSRAMVDGVKARMAGMTEKDAKEIRGTVLYCHPGLNEFGRPVRWGDPDPGKDRRDYLPFPITIEGMEYDGQGRLPRPTLTVSNLYAGAATQGPMVASAGLNMGALVRALGDLNGCTLTHRMTLDKFLDAENFANGNPDADIMQEFPRDIYIFERKVEETSEYIKFELASALDLEGQMLPKRTYNANYCPHKYKGPLCNYNGPKYYDEKDGETTEEKDKCGKRLKSCELRFGKKDGETDEEALARGVDGQLPFGGFPGVGLIARS